MVYGSFGELFKGQYRDTANIVVLESLEKMYVYEMGAFHFGHFDRGVIVFLADSGPLG